MVRMSLASFRFRSRTVFFGLAAAAVSARHDLGLRPSRTMLQARKQAVSAGMRP